MVSRRGERRCSDSLGCSSHRGDTGERVVKGASGGTMVPNDSTTGGLPRVVADGPLDPTLIELLADSVELLPWSVLADGGPVPAPIHGLYTYGHPHVDGAIL